MQAAAAMLVAGHYSKWVGGLLLPQMSCLLLLLCNQCGFCRREASLAQAGHKRSLRALGRGQGAGG